MAARAHKQVGSPAEAVGQGGVLFLAPDVPALESVCAAELGRTGADDILVLAPTTLARHALRGCAARTGRGLSGVRFMTIERAARDVILARAALAGKRLWTGLEEDAVARWRVLPALAQSNWLSRLAPHPGGPETLLGIFRSVREAGWNAERLRAYADGLPPRDARRRRVGAVADALALYERIKTEAAALDGDDLLESAGVLLDRGADGPGVLFIYGYYDFNALQKAFLTRLIARARTVRAFLVCPEREESGAARCPLRGAEFFRSLGLSVERRGASPAPPDLARLRLRLFSDDEQDGPSNEGNAVTLINAPGPAREAEACMRTALAALPGGGVALLSRTAATWAPSVASLADRAGVAAAVPDSAALDESPEGRLAQAVVLGAGEGLRRARVFEILSLAQCLAGGLADVDLVAAERICREEGWFGRADRFRSDLARLDADLAAEDETGEESPGRAACMAELRRVRADIERLLAFSESVAGPCSWARVSADLVALLSGFGVSAGPVAELAARLGGLEGLVEPPASFDEVARLFCEALAAEKLPGLSAGRTPLWAGGVMEARYASFDTVVLAGLSEKAFPSGVRDTPPLVDPQEDLDAHGKCEPGARAARRLDEERYLFYLAIAAARSGLVLSYSRFDEGGTPLLPSQFLVESCRALTGERCRSGVLESAPAAGSYLSRRLKRVAISRLGPDVGEPVLDLWEFDLSVAGRLVRDAGRAGAVPYVAAVHPRAERGYFAERMRWEDPRFNDFCGRITDPDALALLRGRWDPSLHVQSASPLETYSRCPAEFLLHYVLGVDQPDSAEEELWDPREFGSCLHSALAEVYRRWASQGRLDFAGLPAAALVGLVRELVEHVRARVGPGTVRGEAAAARAQARFGSLMVWEQTNAGPRPSEFEIEFGSERAATPDMQRPAEIALDSGAVLRFKGRIDRLDRGPGGLRIIDYKSGGGKAGAVKLNDSLPLQLFIYPAALEMLRGQPVGDALLLHLKPPCTAAVLAAAQRAEDLPVLREVLSGLIDHILSGWFPPTGAASGDRECGRCACRTACGPALYDLVKRKVAALDTHRSDRADWEFLTRPVSCVMGG